MKAFMDKDFILSTKTAKELYHNIAEKLPIIDYHCHIDAKEIALDRKFSNIAEVWLGADHYKWRAMRTFGITENLITGDASDFEKWCAFCKVVPSLIGSPLYHWAHLELKRYFGIEETLSPDTAEKIWNSCNKQLETLTARKMIENSNVEIICTTNDPLEDLSYHKSIAEDLSFKTKVFPAFRPDKAVAIDKPDFADYISKLSAVSKKEIKNFEDLKEALEGRIEHFANHGCRAADHGLDYIPFKALPTETVNKIFQKALKGKALTQEEIDGYKTAIITFCASQYQKRDWVMEVHFGVIRNTNTKMFKALGADTGFDTAGEYSNPKNLTLLLDHLNKADALPKTVIFPIDPSLNTVIQTICGAFQRENVMGYVQQGAAWWFNDTKYGMEAQLKAFSELSVLGCFVGMLTDSRSFLSYTRHEYFRRIFCNFIGNLAENGEYPNDKETLEKIVADVCYNNAKNYFGWK